MDEKQQAIEKIKDILKGCYRFRNDKHCPHEFADCGECRIEDLLSLKSSSGNPLLGIIAADQSLPMNNENDIPNISPRRVCEDTQQTMLKQGWVKILK